MERHSLWIRKFCRCIFDALCAEQHIFGNRDDGSTKGRQPCFVAYWNADAYSLLFSDFPIWLDSAGCETWHTSQALLKFPTFVTAKTYSRSRKFIVRSASFSSSDIAAQHLYHSSSGAHGGLSSERCNRPVHVLWQAMRSTTDGNPVPARSMQTT